MRLSKKLTALIMAFVMILTVVPAFAFGESKASPLTKSEREVKLAQLESFNARLREMEKKYADTDYASKDASDPYASARIVVKSGMDVAADGALAKVSGYNDWQVIQFATAEEAEAACKALSDVNGVEWAEPDCIMTVTATPGSSSFKSWGYQSGHINAYEYNEWLYAQYGSDLANMPEVIVAVVDTGADLDHPFLVDRLIQGYNVPANNNNPEDGHSHGTHVCGTVVDGTLANVKVMPIKVLGDNGSGSTLDVVIGMEYAYLHGAAVENLSLGSTCDEGEAHHLMAEVIDAAFSNGTAVVAAAGNEGVDARFSCPGNIPRVCTVAAINQSHALADFSNYGECVDVAAPGVGINSSVVGGGYDSFDGTSMASPHVAAVAAMIKSANPEMNADELVTSIKGTAVVLNSTGAGAGMAHLAGGNIFSLNDAGNASGGHIHFTSSGSYAWTVDGNSLASGNVGANSTTSLLAAELTVGTDMELIFDCKVSSEANDSLIVKANGETIFTLSGEHGWQTQTVAIPCIGSARITFEFVKDGANASGSDRAWIRNMHLEGSVSTFSNISGGTFSFVSNGTYPWTVSADECAAMSGNAGVNSSSSTMSTTVEIGKGMMLLFKYKVSAAQGDNLTVKLNNSVILTSGETDGFVDFQYIIPSSGTYTVEFTFTKNASGASGADCAYIKAFNYYHTFESAVNGTENFLPFDNTDDFAWGPIRDFVCSTNFGEANSESSFSLTLNMTAGETLSFRYCVSCDGWDDGFKFFVDGVQKLSVSNANWTSYTFTADQTKTYVFKWAYQKGSWFDYNEDATFIDDVVYSGNVGIMGDADSSGSVSIADAILILRYSMGLISANELDLAMSDMDANGSVSVADAITVLRLAMGIAQ